MSDVSRLELVIDSKGVVTANGNLDLFKKKSDEAAKSGTNLENSAKRFGPELSSALFGSMTAATLAADAIRKTAQAGIELVKSSLEASGRLEMIKANLTTVMGSAELAQSVFQDLTNFANTTPFEISGISESAIMLKQSGVAANDLIKTLGMLGDASGGSQEKLNRIALNYAQIMSVGKAATMDIKQFAMAGLPIYDSLAQVTGKTAAEIGEMASSGKLTRDIITEAFKKMTSEGGTFFNGMARGAETLEGKLSTLNDAWTSFKAELADSSGLADATKSFATTLTSVLANMTDALENNRIAREAFAKKEAGLALTTREEYALVNAELEKIYTARQSLSGLSNVAQLFGPVGGAVTNLAVNQVSGNIGKDKEQELIRTSAALAHQLAVEEMLARFRKESVTTTNNVTEAEKEWQKALKDTLGVSDVSSKSKAIEEYMKGIETSMNGALAYAQAFGGNAVDVYEEYAQKVRDAIKKILETGQFTINERSMSTLSNFETDLASKKGFGSPFDQGMGEAAYSQTNLPSFKLGSPEGSTGFNFEATQGIDSNQLLDDEKTSKDIENAEKLKKAFDQLGNQLKRFAADATFDALWDMGEALYEGEDAAKAFGRSLLLSILQNVPSMLFQAGFQMAITPGGLIPGLALMAVSGLAGVGAGYLTAMLNDTGDEKDETAELESMIERLEDIISKVKDEALYYQDTLRHINATSANVEQVNDAIIAPGGKIISTAPDDYLIATKTPGSLAQSSGSTVNIEFKVENYASDAVAVSYSKKQSDDGTTQLITVVRKIMSSDIASGELDTAFDAMDSRRAGIRRSN